MDISFLYSTKRKELGKPCSFTDVGPHLLTEIDSELQIQQMFYQIPFIDKEVDNTKKMAIHGVNTDSVSLEDSGMCHEEGGWPAGVDTADEDSMARFRKNISKEKNYITSVKAMADFIEYFINENNSIDIYEEYFSGQQISSSYDGPFKIVSNLQDPSRVLRKIVDLSWSLDSSKIAGAYSITGMNNTSVYTNFNSYVWNIRDNVSPYCTLTPEFPMNCIAFSPTEMNLIASGYSNGQIALWDIRIGGYSQQASDVYESHSEKVTGLKWLETSSRMNIFSASRDGKMKSWDARNLLKATETVDLNSEINGLPSEDEVYNISCVEYDPTLPHKFMIGSEQGKILYFDRKSVNKLEKVFDSQSGPILTIERNAFFPQLFASCEPWIMRIWSEECKISPIASMISRDGYYTDLSWSPCKPSVLYTTKTTGVIEVWDVIGKYTKRLTDVSLEKGPLLSISISDPEYKIACGTATGAISILLIPDCFISTSDEEIDLIANCIVGRKDNIDGKPRSQRLHHIEEPEKSVPLEEKWDPPEKADDLKNEYETLFEKYPSDEGKLS